LGSYGVWICRILDMNFGEFPFRNCLENSLRRLNRESLEGQWDINGDFRSLAPPAELLFGPSPEFPNSFLETV
jgi:hypothetical protein